MVRCEGGDGKVIMDDAELTQEGHRRVIECQ